MISKLKIISICVFSFLIYFSLSNFVLAVALPQVLTNPAINIQNTSATLNGNVFDLGGYGSTNVWFQWGTDTNYGNNTSSIIQNYTGNFSQQIFNLSPNQTFHYRTVAQNNYGTSYGQDMSFNTGQSGNQQITVNAGPDIYLNSGQNSILQGSAYSYNGSYINYSWSCTDGTLSNYNTDQPTYTAPNIVQYNNQTTYTCTLVANNNSGQSNFDSTTIYVNYNNNNNNYSSLNVQTNSATNTYSNQATLNGYVNGSNLYNMYVWFQWGTTISYGYETNHQAMSYSGFFNQHIAELSPGIIYHFRAVTQNYNGQIIYGQDITFQLPQLQQVLGATSVSTGLTNNFLTDSFFVPLLLIISIIWLWKSGAMYDYLRWIKLKVKKN